MAKLHQVGAMAKIPMYWILTQIIFPINVGVKISIAKPNDQIATDSNKTIKGFVPGVDRKLLIFQARKSETKTLIKMTSTTNVRFKLSA